MKKVYEFEVTATISKKILVEVDTDELESAGLNSEQILDHAETLAHENFSVMNDDSEERYNEYSSLIGIKTLVS